jgi:6-phosphogluconolactonase
MAASCYAYVGSFTSEFTGIDGAPMGAPADGLSAFVLDGSTGAFEPLQVLGGMRSPSFVVAHPGIPAVYAVERELGADERDAGALSAFSVDASGHATVSGREPSGGKWPCHLGMHPSGRHLYVTNIASGHLSSFPVDAEGRVGPQDASVAYTGVGSHPRGPGPRTHSVAFSAQGDLLLVCNIGTSEFLLYATEEKDGALSPDHAQSVRLQPGSGPRHAAFHPSLPFAYVVNELNSTVTVLKFTETGITELGSWSTLPEDRSGPSYASELLITASGKFVFASNRGHDSIAVFETTPSGDLVARGHTPTAGSFPRAFAITPDEQLLVAANQKSGTLVSFWLDAETGSLERTGHEIETPTPVSVAFIRMPRATRRADQSR